MSAALESAFVLHRRPFSDSSLLVELFTRDHGRQPVIARGARRVGSRGGVQLQPFSPILAAWRGRGEVGTLTRAEPRGAPYRLEGERLFCAMYLNELVARLTPRGEALEELFRLYEETLARLASDSVHESVLRLFEMGLLEELGYGMLLTHTSGDEPVRAEAWYEYPPTQGPGRVDSPGPATVRGATLHAMAAGDFSETEVRRQARVLMRRLVDYHLDYRTLKSRELFQRRRHRNPGTRD